MSSQRSSIVECGASLSVDHTISAVCSWSQGFVLGTQTGHAVCVTQHNDSWKVRGCSNPVSMKNLMQAVRHHAAAQDSATIIDT